MKLFHVECVKFEGSANPAQTHIMFLWIVLPFQVLRIHTTHLCFPSVTMHHFLNRRRWFNPLQRLKTSIDFPLSLGLKACALSSLSFLTSFPYDFMHLIWANLIPNLILLSTGKFKDLGHNGQDYVVMPTVWSAIGEATFKADKTIPAAFWGHVPNIALERLQMIAGTYSIWMLYLTPVKCLLGV